MACAYSARLRRWNGRLPGSGASAAASSRRRSRVSARLRSAAASGRRGSGRGHHAGPQLADHPLGDVGVPGRVPDIEAVQRQVAAQRAVVVARACTCPARRGSPRRPPERSVRPRPSPRRRPCRAERRRRRQSVPSFASQRPDAQGCRLEINAFSTLVCPVRSWDSSLEWGCRGAPWRTPRRIRGGSPLEHRQRIDCRAGAVGHTVRRGHEQELPAVQLARRPGHLLQAHVVEQVDAQGNES